MRDSAPASLNLKGLRVLVCRPQEQAEPLCAALQQAGADARCLPFLQIEERPESPEDRRLAQGLDRYRRVIVISPTATRLALDRLEDYWPQWPVGQDWYAVGEGSGRLLARAGLAPRTPPQGCTSEDLLTHPELQSLGGEPILLCKGESGRDLLVSSLRARGALVDEWILYRRQCPHYSATEIEEAFCRFDPQVLITLSGETLMNLISVVHNRDTYLYQRMVVVPVERVAQAAQAAGFRQILIPPALTPAAIVRCLAQQE